jgi:hypothetical protein
LQLAFLMASQQLFMVGTGAGTAEKRREHGKMIRMRLF